MSRASDAAVVAVGAAQAMMMNKKTLVLILAVLLALVGVVALMWRATAPPPELLAESEPKPKSTAEPTAAAVAVAPVRARPEKRGRERVADPVTLVLARVNGVAISPMDLVAGGSREPLEPDTARELLEKAIDRELILEAAQTQGLRLRPDQEESLDKYRNELWNNEAYTTSMDSETRARMEAELDFQLRETTAQFFLPELAGPPQQMDAGTVATEEETMRLYLRGLRAAAQIEREDGK